MRRLASTLAGRRPFAVETAIGTTEHESRGLVEVEPEIAGLLDRSTDELRLVWRQLHRAGPPVGLSRDLPIRAMAARAPHSGAVCRAWPKRQTKALWPSIAVSC